MRISSFVPSRIAFGDKEPSVLVHDGVSSAFEAGRRGDTDLAKLRWKQVNDDRAIANAFTGIGILREDAIAEDQKRKKRKNQLPSGITLPREGSVASRRAAYAKGGGFDPPIITATVSSKKGVKRRKS